MLRFSVFMSFLIIFLLSVSGCTYINNLFKKDEPLPPIEEVPYDESYEEVEEIEAEEEIEPIDPNSRPFPHIEIDENNFIIHTIKRGETLSVLSQHYYGDSQKYTLIAWFNDILNVNKIYAGQKVKIPVIKKMRTLTPPIEKPSVRVADKTESEPPTREKEVVENSITEESIIPEPEEVTIKPEEGTAEAADKLPEKEAPSEEPESTETEEQPVHVAKVDEQGLKKEYLKGIDFFKQEKYYEARSKFKNVIDLNPSYQSVQKYYDMSDKIIFSIQKGTRLYYAGKYESSFDEFSNIIELNKNSAIAHNYLNNLVPSMIKEARADLNDRQKPCAAINLLNKALHHVPGNTEAKSLLKEAHTASQKMNLICK